MRVEYGIIETALCSQPIKVLTDKKGPSSYSCPQEYVFETNFLFKFRGKGQLWRATRRYEDYVYSLHKYSVRR
jgi:hypothetical protein